MKKDFSELKIKDLKIKESGIPICKHATLFLQGVCGLIGNRSLLQSAIMDIISNSPRKYAPNREVSFKYELYYNESFISHEEYKKMSYVEIGVDMNDTVKNTLEFLHSFTISTDEITPQRIIKDFKLEYIQNKELFDLNSFEFEEFMIASKILTQPNFVFLRDFNLPTQRMHIFLSAIKELCKIRKSVVVVDIAHKHGESYDLDSYIFIENNIILENKYTNFSKSNKNLTEKILLYNNSNLELANNHRKEETLDNLQSKSNYEYFCCNSSSSDSFFSDDSSSLSVDLPKKIRYGYLGYESKNVQMKFIKRLATLNFYKINFKHSFFLIKRKFRLHSKFENFNIYLLLFLLLINYLSFFRKSSISNNGSYNYIKIETQKFFKFWFKYIILFYISSVKNSTCSNYIYLFLESNLVKFLANILNDKIENYKIAEYSFLDYKILSTIIYMLTFIQSSCVLRKEYEQHSKNINFIYTPGTYYFYLFLYSILSVGVPLSILILIFSFYYGILFLFTGTFMAITISILTDINVIRAFCCLVLSINLCFPLEYNINLTSHNFLFYVRNINPLALTRDMLFVNPIAMPKNLYFLTRCYISMYIFCIYKISRM